MNRFRDLRVEANVGNPASIETMEYVLDTIIRYVLALALSPDELARIPSQEECEAAVRKEAEADMRRAFAQVHTGWDEEELGRILEDAVRRAAVERRADLAAPYISELLSDRVAADFNNAELRRRFS
jgi:hypothetical protein